jgi:hypothetical protein
MKPFSNTARVPPSPHVDTPAHMAVRPMTEAPVRLRDLGMAAVAGVAIRTDPATDSPEGDILRKMHARVTMRGADLAALLDECLRTPASEDERLIGLARALGLDPLEMLVVSLAAAVEDDPLVGRLLAHVQAPMGASRPTLGLVQRALAPITAGRQPAMPVILGGPAIFSGLLQIDEQSIPLPERSVKVPVPMCLALAGYASSWPGATIGVHADEKVPLGRSAADEARSHAMALRSSGLRTLVVRTGSAAERRSAAAMVATFLDLRPVFLGPDHLAGLGPWLISQRLLPIFCFEPGPGERCALPDIPGYRGPILAVCGLDGAIYSAGEATAGWTLGVPPREERCSLWNDALGQGELAMDLGTRFRHGAGQIARLSRLAGYFAALAGTPSPSREDVLAAGWAGESGGLDSLAEPLRTSVPEEALVTSPELRHSLDMLLLRCRHREDLVTGVGVAASTRYRPGVRALFTGASGTGKTLAAGWIASRMGLPLFRVDLATVTSKYIGETEKNLSQLLARAEQAEVILLFDEADSLFGKRTDIGDSNDRFANAQTNYLLQRIEHYEGIILLTSNSQVRFDQAFARRLDFTVDFPPPGPEERRVLWQRHLGPGTSLTQPEMNRLAVLLDLSGGSIRNVVLAASAAAIGSGREISFPDVLTGLAAEYRKLGRQLPMALNAGTEVPEAAETGRA